MSAPYGESHGNAKQPDSMVKLIRDRYFDEKASVRGMAREYGISENTIWDWLKFRTRVVR